MDYPYSAITQQIIDKDDFVTAELEHFLVYYNLKHTLRWGKDNSQKDETESVAEHVYGMQILLIIFYHFIQNSTVSVCDSSPLGMIWLKRLWTT